MKLQQQARPIYLHMVKTWEHSHQLSRLIEASSDADKKNYPHRAALVEDLGAKMAACFDQLPSGSGFDSGVAVTPVWSGTQPGKITCFFIEAPYHPMDDLGFYKEWITCRFRVEPAFDGIDLVETKHDGPYTCEDVEYIAETLYQALTQEHTL